MHDSPVLQRYAVQFLTLGIFKQAFVQIPRRSHIFPGKHNRQKTVAEFNIKAPFLPVAAPDRRTGCQPDDVAPVAVVVFFFLDQLDCNRFGHIGNNRPLLRDVVFFCHPVKNFAVFVNAQAPPFITVEFDHGIRRHRFHRQLAHNAFCYQPDRKFLVRIRRQRIDNRNVPLAAHPVRNLVAARQINFPAFDAVDINFCFFRIGHDFKQNAVPFRSCRHKTRSAAPFQAAFCQRNKIAAELCRLVIFRNVCAPLQPRAQFPAVKLYFRRFYTHLHFPLSS